MLAIGALLIPWHFTKALSVKESPIEIPETVIEESIIVVEEPKTERQIIEEYFKDIPIMVDVARCESTYRQFDENGNVLRGKVNSQDVGALQVNEYWHLKTSKQLGLDIYTLKGNLAYGRYIYSQEGTKPWNASSGCWGKYREVVLK